MPSFKPLQRLDLDFAYPERLVATERALQSRVMVVEGGRPLELEPGGIDDLIQRFQPGDLLVINDTLVLKRRLFSEKGLEILFLGRKSETDWEVLCPASRWKDGQTQILPDGVQLQLVARGRPQVVRTNRVLDDAYFQNYGDLPLPPYIQKARGERRNRQNDERSYQTAWADRPGSLAAPTASLHFDRHHIEAIRGRGANIARITLHVGLGTFLPITAENLDEHLMHSECLEISGETWRAIQETKSRGARVWALGTTVTRALEAAAHGHLKARPAVGLRTVDSANESGFGGFWGETDIFIRPGFEFRIVDVLCTNFHQPQSTLLALVAAFAGLERVKSCYQWAIEREFRLFSYGDLSVWIKK